MKHLITVILLVHSATGVNKFTKENIEISSSEYFRVDTVEIKEIPIFEPRAHHTANDNKKIIIDNKPSAARVKPSNVYNSIKSDDENNMADDIAADNSKHYSRQVRDVRLSFENGDDLVDIVDESLNDAEELSNGNFLPLKPNDFISTEEIDEPEYNEEQLQQIEKGISNDQTSKDSEKSDHIIENHFMAVEKEEKLNRQRREDTPGITIHDFGTTQTTGLEMPLPGNPTTGTGTVQIIINIYAADPNDVTIETNRETGRI